MKLVSKCILYCALLLVLTTCAAVAQSGFGIVPPAWQKLTGVTKGYVDQPDGIAADRENSYAWSMDVMGNYLYVGTSRNVLAPMLLALGTTPATWPQQMPYPTDMRGRIFRMNLTTKAWEQVYLCDPVTVPNQPILGADLGYRMMKTSSVGGTQMLYVGGLGMNACRLLAVSSTGKVTPVFATVKPNKIISIRAITEHLGNLFWASEDANGPALWYSANPLKDAATQSFGKITVPSEWFTKGCEIWDMISFNGALYVFLTPYDEAQLGFWCAKLVKKNNAWTWQLLVGDTSKGARYPAGMGLPSNGAGVPVVFKGKLYVGTMDATAIRMMNESGNAGGPPPDMGGAFSSPVGVQIFRFDTKDKPERLIPPAQLTDSKAVAIAGGFVNPLNRYIWRFGVQGSKLYAGTFDSRSMVEMLQPILGLDSFQWWNPSGFDMFSTVDGKIWIPETIDGFVDGYNYGARSFATDPKTGNMFLGTANPFYGCQVWMRKATK